LELYRRFGRIIAVTPFWHREKEMSRPISDDGSGDELMRYAFHMDPQVEPSGDSWTASYPEADWSVSGASRLEALQRLGQEFIRRQNAGDDPLAYADDIFRRHLRDPVPGVYALQNELYRALVHAPADERQRTIEEAERRRRLGRSYTLADYQRDRDNPQP
jgi:hypothetical protein